jgi:large subunit ribosomal protein L18
MLTSSEKMLRRQERNRSKLKSCANGKLRLSVFRSCSHIYAQIIDDSKHITVVAASSLDKELKQSCQYGSNKDAAEKVGKLIAERAVKSGIKDVYFDRGGYLYHGRVKALADSARSNGLSF